MHRSHGRSPWRALLLSASGAASLALAACAEMPAVGPSAAEIEKVAEASKAYRIVDVTQGVIDAQAQPQRAAFSAFGAADPPEQFIGQGDTIAVTIWDSGSLFSSGDALVSSSTNPAAGSTGGQATVLPTQMVGRDGNIAIPYVGAVQVAGRTPAQVDDAIALALRGKAVLPQVVVSIVDNQNNSATVLGDVAHPGRILLPLPGLRLLDAIALSGGTVAPDYDMAVQLTREGVSRRVGLDHVVRFDADNVFLHPNDVVYLEKAPRSVVVLGAASHNAEVAFTKSNLSLAEALGNGGGLVDLEADPYGVFVFRYEPAGSPVTPSSSQTSPAGGGGAPVIYHIDMKQPGGFFTAQRFLMHDRDVVYISNSRSVQLAKLIRIFSMAASIVNRSSVVSN